MAQVDRSVRFGAELKDSFKPVNNWVSNGITWLDDIQQFYRERAAIEKEYSTKLHTLAKKNFEKKAKRSSSLSVGDTPALTPGSLERLPLHPVEDYCYRGVDFHQRLSYDLDYPIIHSRI